MIELDFAKWESLAQEVIAGQEDKVYVDEYGARTVCKYVHGMGYTGDYDSSEGFSPGCLVGHMLLKAGVTYEDLRIVNEMDIDNALDSLMNNEVINYQDNESRSFLIALQQQQDQGNTWGNSLKEAKAWAN